MVIALLKFNLYLQGFLYWLNIQIIFNQYEHHLLSKTVICLIPIEHCIRSHKKSDNSTK